MNFKQYLTECFLYGQTEELFNIFPQISEWLNNDVLAKQDIETEPAYQWFAFKAGELWDYGPKDFNLQNVSNIINALVECNDLTKETGIKIINLLRANAKLFPKMTLSNNKKWYKRTLNLIPNELKKEWIRNNRDYE